MPIVISPSLVISGGQGGLPLTHPRIGYQNYVRETSTVVTATSVAANFEADSIKNDLTYEFWKPTTLPATITMTLEEARDIDYCGIAAHNLRTAGCSITIEYYDGSSWVEVDSTNPANNDSIVFLFTETLAQAWRLTVDGVSAPSIGVVFLGKMLQVERRIYQGHRPIVFGKTTAIRPNVSEGGQYIGRSIIRRGATTNVNITNLSSEWVRNEFEPFIESARSFPFFWVWRAASFPKDVAYCWTNEDIQPINSGPKALMSVSFNINANIQ